jgi:hypothetical protein
MLATTKKKGAGKKPAPTLHTLTTSNLPLEENANIENFLFNPNDSLPNENVLISIQGKKLLSTKNVMVISGKPKARKSVVAHSVIGAAISGKTILGIECNLQPNENVCLIDTEQSNHDLKRSLDRMKHLTEMEILPSNFKCYMVRSLNPHAIQQAILQICKNENNRLIIIDGALDLINNMNDVIEVKEVIQFVKQILVEYNVGLVFIIHLSKSTSFTIGHFGSYFDRFSQSVIEVAKQENGNSEIKSQMMRSDADFKPYQFYWNHNINNYSIDWLENLEVTAQKLTDYSTEQHQVKLEKCFKDDSKLLYKNLIKLLTIEYQRSEYFARQLVIHFYELELIQQTSDNKIELIKTPVPF